jgi:hypothetical protein
MDGNTGNVASIHQVGLGLLGAVAGGVLGVVAFGWLVKQGFYALALPGVLLGVGCGVFFKRQSLPMAIFCGLAGLALGIFVEWKHRPFVKDSGFAYFLTHLHQLRPFTLLMLALGALGGFWFAWSAREKPRTSETRSEP